MTFRTLMKSMNERVKPSDALMEDTKQTMLAQLQSKEAPSRKQTVFRYSAVVAGLAVVLAGAAILPRFTQDMVQITDGSESDPSIILKNCLDPNHTGSQEASPSEEAPDSTPSTPSSQPDEGVSKASPKPVAQLPPIPPESNNGKEVKGAFAVKNLLSHLYAASALPPEPISPALEGLPPFNSENFPASGDGSLESSDSPSSDLVSQEPIDASSNNLLSGAGAGSDESGQSSGEPPLHTVQSSSQQTPSAGGEETSPDSAGGNTSDAPPQMNELTDGSTALVVSVDGSTLYFGEVSSMTVSSWSAPDSVPLEEKQWTTEEAVSYFGRDPRNFSIPKNLKYNSDEPVKTVWTDENGKVYYDNIVFQFSGKGRSLSITMSKLGLPSSRSITLLNRKASLLNGVSMHLGYQSGGQTDSYTAELIVGGVGYQIVSSNLSQREFIAFLQSVCF